MPPFEFCLTVIIKQTGDLFGHLRHDRPIEERIQAGQQQCADDYGNQNLDAGVDIALCSGTGNNCLHAAGHLCLFHLGGNLHCLDFGFDRLHCSHGFSTYPVCKFPSSVKDKRTSFLKYVSIRCKQKKPTPCKMQDASAVCL